MNFPPPTPKQAGIIWWALTGFSIAVIVGLVVALVWGTGQVLQILGPVLWPLAVAGVMAYLLDPVVNWLERRWKSRRMSILLVFVLAFLLLGAVLANIIPQLVDETQGLGQRIPGYAQQLQHKAEEYLNNPPQWAKEFLDRSAKPAALPSVEASPPPQNAIAGSPSPANTNNLDSQTVALPKGTNSIASLGSRIDSDTLQSAGSWATALAPKIGKWMLSQLGRVASWFGVLVALTLIPIYTYYLLAEKQGIQDSWTKYLPVTNSRFKDEMIFVLGAANSYMIAFFRGQVLVAICDGVMYTIGFLAIGLPYAVLLGVAAIFLTLIPFIGAIITCGAALLLALVQYGDWLHPALVLLVFVIVQSIEGFVIAPKILGDKVGLHPLTIIIAIMVGTTLLGGILGGILAIPLTALLRVLMARYIWKRDVQQPAG